MRCECVSASDKLLNKTNGLELITDGQATEEDCGQVHSEGVKRCGPCVPRYCTSVANGGCNPAKVQVAACLQSQWVLHTNTSQWVLHPCTSHWKFNPCTGHLTTNLPWTNLHSRAALDPFSVKLASRQRRAEEGAGKLWQ